MEHSTLIYSDNSALTSMNFASRVMGSISETLAGDTEVESFLNDQSDAVELSPLEAKKGNDINEP